LAEEVARALSCLCYYDSNVRLIDLSTVRQVMTGLSLLIHHDNEKTLRQF